MSHGYEVAAVEAFLAQGGVVQARLRERSEGDVLDWPCGLLPIPDGVQAEKVLAVLEDLTHSGIASQSLAVHRFDSTEYRVTWHIAWQR